MNRRGVALLAVLGVITVLSALALAASLAGREAVATARYRIGHTRASWKAEGCAESARLILDSMVATGVPWEELGQQFPSRRVSCTARLVPAGQELNLNLAGAGQITRFLQALGVPAFTTDSIVQAILDWRDEDDNQRVGGAERGWYAARGLSGPRNGPFAAPEEVCLVRGMATLNIGYSLFGIDGHRVPINLAPLSVVASLPGVGPEILQVLVNRRQRGDPLRELSELAEGIPPFARDTLLAHFAELAEWATITPEAWRLVITAQSADITATATLEYLLAPAEARVGVLRKRLW